MKERANRPPSGQSVAQFRYEGSTLIEDLLGLDGVTPGTANQLANQVAAKHAGRPLNPA